MLMGNFLVVGDRSPHMATGDRESAGPSFGIAHGTVVPGNGSPDELPEDDDPDD